MKSVLISIQRPHTDNIKALIKKIEVRKNKLNQETPFPCFIYETKTKGGCGKVIGKFLCDRIEEFYCASVPYQRENNLGYGRFIDNGVYKVDGWHEGIVFERNDRFIDSMLNNNDLKEMCLSVQELFDYIGIGKHLYAWHISDLKIYDKPKELREFKRWNRTEENAPCTHTKWLYPDCKDCKACNLIRPPQSWCYVESLGE